MILPSRASAAVALVSVLTATLCACSGPSPRSLLRSIDDGAVLLGVKADQPGLGLRGPDGAMSGFDIDVARYVVKQIASARGRAEPRITWRETPTAQREQLIRKGEVDAVIASYSIDKARTSDVTFAGPYLTTQQALLVRDDGAVSSLTDLGAGRTLCSVSGSTSARTVKILLPGVRLTEADSYSSCVDSLRQKKVDAVTTDDTILAGFVQQHPGDGMRVLDMALPADACIDGQARRAGSPFAIERYGIGLAHGDNTARDAVNTALKAMVDSGEWGRALRRDLGATQTERMTARAGGDSAIAPKVGDLSFLSATSTPCTAR